MASRRSRHVGRYTDAQETIWSRRAMTPDELRAIPTVLGLSRAHLAKLLSRSPRGISHWTVGDRPLPYEVGILLQLLAAQKITVRDVEEAAAPTQTNGSAAPDPQPAIADSELEPRVSVPTVDSAPARLKSAVCAPLPTVPSLSAAEKVCALTPTACRWPYGDPRHPDFHFCGDPIAEKSYCKHHHALAYVADSGHGARIPKGANHAAALVALSVPPAEAPNPRSIR